MYSCNIKVGSQQGQLELNPEMASIPGQDASSEMRKSSSKTSIRSKASKTSLKYTSGSRASLKNEDSPKVARYSSYNVVAVKVMHIL